MPRLLMQWLTTHLGTAAQWPNKNLPLNGGIIERGYQRLGRDSCRVGKGGVSIL